MIFLPRTLSTLWRVNFFLLGLAGETSPFFHKKKYYESSFMKIFPLWEAAIFFDLWSITRGMCDGFLILNMLNMLMFYPACPKLLGFVSALLGQGVCDPN